MKKAIAIGSAGFMATAISFGPARMGFGLFAPEFRDAFALSTIQIGVIASLIFVGFLVSLPLSSLLRKSAGERVPIIAGTLSAAIGFFIVAQAHSAWMLAFGVTLAGASAGLCWTPFTDTTERTLPRDARDGTLSAVSSGTAIGVVLTGGLFFWVLSGLLDWRLVWQLFMLLSLSACVVMWLALPRGQPSKGHTHYQRSRRIQKEHLPLYSAALTFGACNGIYLSFAADYVVRSGGLAGIHDEAAAAVIFLSYGAFGVAGLFTGRMEKQVGLLPLLNITFLAFTASLVILALTPDTWPGLIASAALHGAAVMTISAILSFWSLRLFPGRGSQGFTGVLYGVALSGAISPVLAGIAAGTTSLTATLLASALIPLVAALLFGGLHLREKLTN